MSDLILHHYALSPFSEKVRAMLGYTRLPWQSVITREMPPRPHLDILVGGYRKIPVAQQGADIFCDTRIITSEIATLSGKPELALENCSDAIQQFVQRTDLDVFFACVLSARSKAMTRKARATLSLLDLARLLWDRINMGRKARHKVVSPKDIRPMLQAHLQQLERMLDEPFLFGATPTIADFAAYHGLWMIRDMAERSIINPYPRINAWMDRIKAFGDGARREISIDASLAAARAATPRPIADAHRQDGRIGREVTIAPSDYGLNPTRGRLVGVTPHRWIIAREHNAVGTVHVHFPVQGFTLAS